MRVIKFNEVFVPKYRTYLLLIFLILACVCMITIKFIPFAFLIYVGVLYYTYKKNDLLRQSVIKNMNSVIFKLSTDESILDFPIPATIITMQGDILWNNDGLEHLFKGINKEKYIQTLLKELDEDLDGNFNKIKKEVKIHDRHYMLLGNIVKVRRRTEKTVVLMLYFIDKTEYYRLYKTYEDEKKCVGIVVLDNYDEIIQGMSEADKPQLTPSVERLLREWFSVTNGVFARLDRNRFLIIFERKYIKDFIETKFDILDKIKDLNINNKIPITISMGIVSDDETENEKFKGAFSAIDIALGRGGDQVVVKQNGKYEFFGGKSKEVEKRTKVKSRVVAHALEELINESKNVVIMGHKAMDPDCLGSAIGIYRLSKSLNKDAYIVFNNYGVTIENMLKKLAKDEKEYANVLLETNQIIAKMSQDTLLVIVDTHKKDYVEAPELLDYTKRVVVIDHHRRSAEYVCEPLLAFHEVYASSTSELVTEILQYIDKDIGMTTVEAECLYAGILTDTKNFMYKTGVRTFEAAAYLKKLGVDATAVKKMFRNDVDTFVAIADVIRNSEIIYDNIAIAICPKGIENPGQITAQAADEMLNLYGVETSFVLAEMNGYINISGRSDGNLNVQTILEKLGGGGHLMVAGAQLSDITIDEAKQKLIEVIDMSIKE